MKRLENGLEQEVVAKKQSFTEDEAKRLILQRLFDEINSQLHHYLNTERRKIVRIFEKLWDKYQCPLDTITSNRDEAVGKLFVHLNGLGYLK